MLFEPKNEMGVIVRFAQQCHEFDMKIISIQAEYPDAIIEWNEKELKVEFEYKSSNFYKHGHDPRGCDIIICWINDCSSVIPVIALQYDDWLIHDNFQLATKDEKEKEFWRIKSEQLKKELLKTKARLAELIPANEDSPSDWRLVSNESKMAIADMATNEVVAIYGVSSSTARRWRRWSQAMQGS